MSFCLYIGLWIFFSILFIMVGYSSKKQAKDVLKIMNSENTIRVKGSVVGYKVQEVNRKLLNQSYLELGQDGIRYKKTTPVYFPIYEYILDGKTERFTSNVYSNFKILKPGAEITLYINKKDKSIIDTQLYNIHDFGSIFLYVGIAFLMLPFVLILFVLTFIFWVY